jgi:flagellar motor protein MotB
MKKVFFLLALLALSCYTDAQLLKKISDKAKQKTSEKIDKTVDKTIDSTLNKSDKEAGDASKGTNENNSGETAAGSPAAGAGEPAVAKTEDKPTSLKAYSKYDFVPGERIIVFEDFMQDAVGDFPARWNTNSSGEVVTIEGQAGHWFMMPKAGVFLPEFIDSLADNFTFEFDLITIHGNKTGGWPSFHTAIAELSNREKPQEWQMENNIYYFSVYAGNSTEGSINFNGKKNGESQSALQISTKQFGDKTKPVHISIWRQKERCRIYFNEEKVSDLPKALAANAKFNSILFFIPSADDDNNYCITNLRLAVGVPDTRKKILEQNKWVTHGILFDVNSDNIKPESYGTLKEMATVLKDYPDLRVKIVGHTDSDGSDASNLDLSKRRAASVKASLAKDFGIDESRMETDGKGESEPIDKNDKPAGKANNRRVEFIKL